MTAASRDLVNGLMGILVIPWSSTVTLTCTIVLIVVVEAATKAVVARNKWLKIFIFKLMRNQTIYEQKKSL